MQTGNGSREASNQVKQEIAESKKADRNSWDGKFRLVNLAERMNQSSCGTGSAKKTLAPIEKLPVELLLQITSYLGPYQLSQLRKAGSRYLASVVRAYPLQSLNLFIDDLKRNARNLSDAYHPIVHAAAEGHAKLVEYFLNAEECTSRSRWIDKALLYAVERDRSMVLPVLLEQRPNLTMDIWALKPDYIQPCQPWTPLHLAVIKGHGETVTALLRYLSATTRFTNTFPYVYGAPFYERNMWMSILHVAAAQGNPALLKTIIDYGADVNYAYACTKLANSSDSQLCACRYRFPRLLHGGTALHIAAKYGQQASVLFLLENGASTRCLDEEGNMPLHVAANFGQEDVVNVLLKKGSNINARNQRLHTPLWFAVTQRKIEIVRLLLENGARKEEGILTTAVNVGHKQIIEILILNGIKISSDTLAAAIRQPHSCLLDFLLNEVVRNHNIIDWGCLLLQAAVAGKASHLHLLLKRAQGQTVTRSWNQLLVSFARLKDKKPLKFLLRQDIADTEIEESSVKEAVIWTVRETNAASLDMLLHAEQETVRKVSRIVYEGIYNKGDYILIGDKKLLPSPPGLD